MSEGTPHRTSILLSRALDLLCPDAGPGGYFLHGSVEALLNEAAKAVEMTRKIVRTQVRSWMEVGLGPEFGVDRSGSRPSLQVEFKHGRPLPNTSIKWNKVTLGTTTPLNTEIATMRYLESKINSWGNNRSPNNDYVAGSTLSRGFQTPIKTVYFDHLTGDATIPTASEAFTGPAPGAHDVESWIFLARKGVVRPGEVFDFQNELGQSVSQRTSREIVTAGFRLSVVPYSWWSRFQDEMCGNSVERD